MIYIRLLTMASEAAKPLTLNYKPTTFHSRESDHFVGESYTGDSPLLDVLF